MLVPEKLVVSVGSRVIDGHLLEGLELAGYALGPPLGTAPVVLVVGGITASPFPFGGDGEAWWPALHAEDLIDPSKQTEIGRAHV